jgi:hypothetical protein
MSLSRIPWLALALAVLLSRLDVCRADDNPIADRLNEAKIAYASALEKAKEELLGQFDAAIQAAAKTGDLDAVRAIRGEKQTFDSTGNHLHRRVPFLPFKKRVLAGIHGALAGGGESVQVTVGEDGFWYLDGMSTNEQPLVARAVAVKLARTSP